MPRNGVVFAPPPPSFMALQQNTLPQQQLPTKSDSIFITFLVIATALIVSAILYLLLRSISIYRHRRRPASDHTQLAPETNSLIHSLPLFTFASIIASKPAADCAVCLSKFHPQDKLRLLPLCCHVFHAQCIDVWLATNQTCPLCRSSVFVSQTEIHQPDLSSPDIRTRSFRIEIGSVSRRGISTDFTASDRRRSYSIGSFDYIVDELVSEVTVPSNRRGLDLEKTTVQTEEALAAELGGRGSWLKDYVDRLTWTAPFSLSSSLRSSGRFFTGSSRRTDESRVNESDLEASRLGDEIGEMFRWLSGV